MADKISGDDVFKALIKRWPELEPHIRRLRRAIRRGDEADAKKLAEGLAIAVEAFAMVPDRRPEQPTSPVSRDMENS